MLRFQDPLSTWGSGSTSRANMILAQNGWLNVPGGWACSNENGAAPGGWSLKYAAYAGDESNLRLSLGGAVQEFGHAVRIYVDSIPLAGRDILWLCDNAATRQVKISVQADGSLYVANANNTGLGASVAGVITPGSFIHVELKTKIATSATGYIQIRVNKRTVLNLTGVQTKGTGASDTAAYIEFFPGSGYHVNPALAYIATPIVWDTTGSFCNDFLGPKVPYLVQLTSDGTPTDWDVVGGAGSSYGTVDNIPQNGASQYLEATVDGDVTKMNFEAKSLSNVVALTIQHTDRLATAGSSTMTVSLTDGVDEAAGTDRNPAYPAWTAYQDTFYEDPASSGVGSLTAPLAAGDLGVKLERTA